MIVNQHGRMKPDYKGGGIVNLMTSILVGRGGEPWDYRRRNARSLDPRGMLSTT